MLWGCAGLDFDYRVRTEALGVNYVDAPAAHLHVSAEYSVDNAGHRPLNFIDVSLPDKKEFGRNNLRITFAGKDAQVAALGNESTLSRIALDPRLAAKHKAKITVEYDLAPAAPGSATIAVNSDSFHLRPFGWFPELRAPRNFFGSPDKRAERTILNVSVPADFRVTARGQAGSVRHHGQEATHVFVLNRPSLSPFVIAGRYQEQRVAAAFGATVFWSFLPLPKEAAQEAGQRLASAWTAYQNAFGRIEPESSLYFVETRADLGTAFRGQDGTAAVGLPAAVLFNENAFTLGPGSVAFRGLAARGLVATWFGEQVGLRPDAEIVMGEGLGEYAAAAVASSEGSGQREAKVRELLQRYDEAKAQKAEKPIAAVTLKDPSGQRQVALLKGSLFFFALQDAYGQEALDRALGSLVGIFSGQRVGYTDLRVALQRETGHDPAEFFRAWLDQTGIPAEFRRRYENSASRQGEIAADPETTAERPR